ncbi:transposase [Myxococcota bacterium]|nr:transposase [Myxococcota bacterium]MBU1411954.1 transposase [Myxococcota bacterium]MBU1512363.1 transposase [Myxococcota bacterium]
MQRFGGALNTNPHFHVLVPDGLFTPGASEDDRARFISLPPPTHEDIAHLAATVSTRLTKHLRETIGKARESEADRDDTLVATLLHRAVQLALWLPRSGPAGDDSTAADHVLGYLTWTNEQVVLDATNDILKDPIESTVDPDVTKSWFEFVPVTPTTTCADLIEQKEALFPRLAQ